MALSKTSTPGATALAILATRACIDPNCRCQQSKLAGEGLTHCPAHHDRSPSLSVTVADKCLWYCHAGCNQDDVTDALIALEIDAESFEGKAATKDYGHSNSKGKLVTGMWFDLKWGKPSTTYQYRDESGLVLYQKLRYQRPDGTKQFVQRRCAGQPDLYYTKLGDVQLVPYRLPELIASDLTALVVMVEGEKSADRLAETGLTVTIYKGWRSDWSKFLRGRRILMLPDNDAAGEEYTAKAVKALKSVAQDLRIMRLPGLPEGGDVFDFIEQGHGEVLLATVRSL
jgi:putative DNA primase/helicase